MNPITVDMDHKFQIDHCDCASKICGCESNSRLTKGSVEYLMGQLGLDTIDGEKEVRLDAIHLIGTIDQSTSDLENWLIDFGPIRIEWINDCCCNLVFESITHAFRVFEALTEEWDANASEIDAILRDCGDGGHGEACARAGGWRLVADLPEGASRMLMRVARTDDVKIRDSEKRTRFYTAHGNQRYQSGRNDQRKRTIPTADACTKNDSRLVGYDDLPTLVRQYRSSDSRDYSRKKSESNSEKSDDDFDEETSKKKRRMISSMSLYSDQIPDNRGGQVKVGTKRGSVHSRLG